jgi:benzoate-CoA ligase family protein
MRGNEMGTLPAVFNLTESFLDAPATNGRRDSPALWFKGEPISYLTVLENTCRAAHVLRGLGVRIENRVLLVLDDKPEFIYLFLGALRIGAVPVPAPPGMSQDYYEFLLQDSRAVLAAADGQSLPAIWAIARNRTPHLGHVLAVGERADPRQEKEGSFEALAAAAPTVLACERTSPDDVAFWLYSSGTTGAPKAVIHLHRAPVSTCEGYADGVLGIRPGDRILSAARLFSASGLGNSIFFPFWAGASAVLMPGTPTPARLAEVARDMAATVLFARPASYRAMLAEGRPDVFSSLRVAVCSGDRLPREVFQAMRDRFGVELLEGTGSTEALHIYLSNRPGRVRPGSTGELVPGLRAQIVDEDGHLVGPGEIGDLHIQGGSTFASYWHNREKTQAALLGSWLVTGDKYRVDPDGYYWYVGRADDMWLQDGEWIAPAEIEEVLTGHDAIGEAAVAGVDRDGQRRAIACVVTREPAQASAGLAAELRARVRARLGASREPAEVRFVARLPRTASGKVQRFRLRDLESLSGEDRPGSEGSREGDSAEGKSQ